MWHRPDTSFILPCPVSSFFPLHFHSQHPCETCWMVWFCWDTLHTSIKNYSSTISFICSSLGKINAGFGRHFHPVLHRERGRNHSSMQVWGFFFFKLGSLHLQSRLTVKVADLCNYQNPHKRNFIVQVGMHSQDGTFQRLWIWTNYKQLTKYRKFWTGLHSLNMSKCKYQKEQSIFS